MLPSNTTVPRAQAITEQTVYKSGSQSGGRGKGKRQRRNTDQSWMINHAPRVSVSQPDPPPQFQKICGTKQ